MLLILLIGLIVAILGLFALMAYITVMISLAIAGAVYFVCLWVCVSLFPGNSFPFTLLTALVAGTLVNYGLYRAVVAQSTRVKTRKGHSDSHP